MKEKTDQLIDQLEKQPDDAQTRRLEMLEEEVRRLSKIEEEIAAEIEAAVSAYDAADSEATAGGAAGTLDDIDEFDGIEELDGEIELDDLFRELDEAAQAQAAQQPAQQQFVQAQAAQPPQQPAEQQIPPQQFAAQQPVQQQQFVQPQQPAQQQVWQQIPDAAEQPQQPETGETRYHQGYNIGRSGRKYTAEELNMLIRE